MLLDLGQTEVSTLCIKCGKMTINLGLYHSSNEWIYGCESCNVLYKYKASSFVGVPLSFELFDQMSYKDYIRKKEEEEKEAR